MAIIALIGGGGIRTPQLIYGLAEAAEELCLDEVRLYDLDPNRTRLMAALGSEIARKLKSPLRISAVSTIESAVAGASFVVSSIRVGGIEARARDEAIAVRHGLAGQETTGPGGWAMALRTIPVTLAHARIVEREAPDAWLVTFTNPAGLIAQALTCHTRLRVVGICDTPAELFHQIAKALNKQPAEVECDYLGLNHLGWVRRVMYRGEDVMHSLLSDDAKLASLYPAPLFDPKLIRSLGLIPSEYLYFYYSQHRAYRNQVTASATRGAEVAKLNAALAGRLEALVASGRLPDALAEYTLYLQRRSGSYMQLEGAAGSIAGSALQADDPFSAPTGYHRIAISVIRALLGCASGPMVVNTPNGAAIPDFAPEDVVEVPCRINPAGVEPLAVGPLPPVVRGLALAVKEFERQTIEAAVRGSRKMARLALFLNPIAGEWDAATAIASEFFATDCDLGYLK
jgi:6-phospho-beta-glucosidase